MKTQFYAGLFWSRFFLTALLFAVGATRVSALTVVEGADFANSGNGSTYTLDFGVNVISGTLTTPDDFQDHFRVTVPAGLRLTQVSKNFPAGGVLNSPNVNFNGEDKPGTGTATFGNGFPLGPGTYSAFTGAGVAFNNGWSLTFTVAAAPDYAITNVSGLLVVTNVTGNSDTLTVSSPDAGTVKFAAPGRYFSINGAAPALNDSGNISLSGVTNVTVNGGTGNDTFQVGGSASAAFPSLTINGGIGNDAVNLNGDITFGANKNLDIDLQNDGGAAGVDSVTVAAGANLVTSGTGTITVRCSQNVSLASGSSLEVQNGDLTVEANQQIPADTGNFIGVNLDGATIKSTGSGIVTVNGIGGNDPGGYQLGVQVINGAKIMGGNSYVFVTGGGGASTNIVNRGVTVYGAGSAITSANASVYVTGRAGTVGSYFGIGVSILFGAEISAGGNGLVTVIGNGNGAVGSGYNMGIEMDGVGSRIYSNGRDVTVNGGAGPGGSYGLFMADSAAIYTPAAGGSIDFYIDTLSLDNTTSITNAGGSHVRFKAGPPSTKIDLGGADDSHTLGISNAELSRVTTANLEFYNPSGSIIISSIIINTIATNLTLLTAPTGFIPGAAGADFFLPNGTLNIIQSSPLTCSINGPVPDTDYSQLLLIGAVNLTEATLTITGAYSGAVGDSFTIVNNLGTNNPTVGNFIGLPQGSYLNLNGQPARIYYNGGDGNDVVLVRTLPQLSPLAGFTNGGWRFTGIGIPSNTYTIQATTNFITWTNIGPVIGNSNGIFSFIDSNAAQFKYRFYRITN